MTAVLTARRSALVPPPAADPTWHSAAGSLPEAHVPATYDGAPRPLPGMSPPVYRAECGALCSDSEASPDAPRCRACAEIHADHTALYPLTRA
ncbi:hypothetical protein GCM10022247_35200 [Allokutzneria multivorans]|uniref:Uncharacterized protein n=1 Tax=Allokutzneria multivorans TaxID=1142134 RepID=A0ABP7SCW5_9PSEU